MKQQHSDTLLPPIEHEDFLVTTVYGFLVTYKECLESICRFLSAAGLNDLDFAANPGQGFYTQYDQEDFDEVVCYLEDQEAQSIFSKAGRQFYMIDTPVGRFVLCCNDNGDAYGILSKKG